MALRPARHGYRQKTRGDRDGARQTRDSPRRLDFDGDIPAATLAAVVGEEKLWWLDLGMWGMSYDGV